MEKLTALKNWLATPKAKKIMLRVAAGLIVFWVAFRIVMLILTGRQAVFNVARFTAENGVPVNVVVMAKTDGVISTPVAVRSNTAHVASSVAHLLRAGMKIGEGEIVSVSSGLDLDSGMHLVRTRGVSDGLHFAQYRAKGYFIPAYAVVNDAVMVVESGHAATRMVKVARADSENALISDGLKDGDVVIVSHIDAGAPVQVLDNK